MEYSVGVFGDLVFKVRVVWRIINRDVIREVVMLVSLNWMCCNILFKMFLLVFFIGVRDLMFVLFVIWIVCVMIG